MVLWGLRSCHITNLFPPFPSIFSVPCLLSQYKLAKQSGFINTSIIMIWSQITVAYFRIQQLIWECPLYQCVTFFQTWVSATTSSWLRLYVFVTPTLSHKHTHIAPGSSLCLCHEPGCKGIWHRRSLETPQGPQPTPISQAAARNLASHHKNTRF